MTNYAVHCLSNGLEMLVKTDNPLLSLHPFRDDNISIHFLCIIQITAYKINVPKNNDNVIMKSAVEIAHQNFNLRLHTIIFTIDVDKFIVDYFIKYYNGTVVTETRRESKPTKQVVIVAESFNALTRVASKVKPDLKGNSLLNGATKFLIVILNEPYRLHLITKLFLEYNAFNVVIMTKIGYKIALHTFFPYNNPKNCNNSEPKLIGYWNENIKHSDQIYPDKMKNMHECPLYISTNKVYHPMTDQKVPFQITKRTLVRLLRDVMNFTPVITEREYISIDSDRAKNWSDSLNDILNGSANISTCSIALGEDRLGILDYSIPYFRVRIAWIAPPIEPGPVWWRMLSPMSEYLWLVILVIVVFVTLLPFTANYGPIKRFCLKYFKNVDKVRGPVIRVWGVMLGQPIRVMPQRFRDFYIISLWIWFSFVVRSAYQSVLISALKTDTFVGNFDNLKETVESGYAFGGRGGVLGHFEHEPLIKEKFEVIPEEKFEDIMKDVIEGKEKFVLATSMEYAWAYCLSQGKTEFECGHILPDSIITVPLVIWMRENSPLLRTLSMWLPRLLETGLLDKVEVKKPSSGQPIKNNDPTPLNHHQILSCLLGLAIGHALAIFAFVVEILYYNTKRNLAIRQNK